MEESPIKTQASILPLQGKYYGTEIKITTQNNFEFTFKIWISKTNTPSKRELEKWGYTEEQWEANVFVDNGWGELSRIQQTDIICDSHYEDKYTLELAEHIVNKLNREE